MIIWFYISQCFSDLLFLTPEKLSRYPKTLVILSETNPSRSAGEEIVISPYLYLLSTKKGVIQIVQINYAIKNLRFGILTGVIYKRRNNI